MIVNDIFEQVFTLYKRHFLLLIVALALLHSPIILLEILKVTTLQQSSFDLLFQPIVAQLAPSLATQPASSLALDQAAAWILSSLGIALIHFMLTGQLSAALLTHSLVQHQRFPRLGLSHILEVSWRTWLTCLGAGALVLGLGLMLAGVSTGIVWGTHNLFSQSLPNYRDNFQHFLLWLLLVGGLALVCIAGSIVLLIRFLFFPELIEVEGAGLLDSLRRSWQLTGSALWRVLGSATLVWMLILIASSIATTCLSFLFHLIFQEALQNSQLSHIIDRVLYQCSLIVLTPFQLAAYIMLYFELRKRQEGRAAQFE